MSDAILVTYASRTGSTEGVAQAIGQILRESGVRVEVRPVQEVEDVTPYRAVVVGSAVREGSWLPEAMRFVDMHQAALSEKPCAVFLVCMTLAAPDASQFQPHVRAWLDPVRALIHPVSEGFFAGALDINQLPSSADRLKLRLSVLFGLGSEGDHRNWDAIRAWAQSLPVRLERAR